MYKKEYDSSYVGFTGDGAQWLVDNTAIKLVGKKHRYPFPGYSSISPLVICELDESSPLQDSITCPLLPLII